MRCAECKSAPDGGDEAHDIDLCSDCFSKGAEPFNHKKTHAYRVMHKLQENIFTSESSSGSPMIVCLPCNFIDGRASCFFPFFSFIAPVCIIIMSEFSINLTTKLVRVASWHFSGRRAELLMFTFRYTRVLPKSHVSFLFVAVCIYPVGEKVGFVVMMALKLTRVRFFFLRYCFFI